MSGQEISRVDFDEIVDAEIVNPCEADWERRERAWRDNALSERFGDMERRLAFEVGFDHRAFPDACGGGGHGQHGMTMRWLLIGPRGVVQWVANMHNWVPGNIRCGDVGSGVPISLVPANPRFGDTSATDLGYHSPKPLWEGQEEWGTRECSLLPEGYCYYDGSGMNAEPILEAFLAHGPHAVWTALARYYGEVFGTKQVGRSDAG